ncbi:hypothetical protein [Methylocystis iwaonis]|uniref:hypothetical protein n=1 Tax=Methylocystis iwaonis TaxID=2885079 RepID=UPI002E7C2B18|nr:hypothetical protein [Methylocystis iwaonis]
MGDVHLLQLMRYRSKPERKQWDTWYKHKVIIAEAMRNKLLKVRHARKHELPEPEEVVHETIKRILDHDKNFIWDKNVEFEYFFAKCMKCALYDLQNRERKFSRRSNNIAAINKLTPLPPTLEESIECRNRKMYFEDAQKALDSAIADTNIRGNIKKYASNMKIYAENKLLTPEIAAEIGVSPNSIDPYRQRLEAVIAKAKPKK